MPASRSRQRVLSGGSDFRSVVLPAPGDPKIAKEVLLAAAESRSSAVTMRMTIGVSLIENGHWDWIGAAGR